MGDSHWGVPRAWWRKGKKPFCQTIDAQLLVHHPLPSCIVLESLRSSWAVAQLQWPLVWLLSPTKPPMWKMWILPSQPQLHSKWRDLFWCFVSSSERAFSFLCCRTCLDISRTMFAMQFKSSREYGCKDVVFWVLESLIYIIQYQICLTNVYPIQYVWGLHLPWLLRWWYLYLWVTTLFPVCCSHYCSGYIGLVDSGPR